MDNLFICLFEVVSSPLLLSLIPLSAPFSLHHDTLHLFPSPPDPPPHPANPFSLPFSYTFQKLV